VILWRCTYVKDNKRRVRWFVYKRDAFEYAEVLGPNSAPIEVDYEEVDSVRGRVGRFGIVEWLNHSSVAGGSETVESDPRYVKVRT